MERFAALVDGWRRTAGLEMLPADARAWACRVMLDDLGSRYAGRELDHVRAYAETVHTRSGHSLPSGDGTDPNS